MKTQQNKFWLQSQVNDILEPMILACCQKNPDDKIAFMLQYLEDKFGERATKGDKQNLEFLRNEVTRLEAMLEKQKQMQKVVTAGTTDDEKEPQNSEDETDSDVSISLIDKSLYRMRTTTQMCCLRH